METRELPAPPRREPSAHHPAIILTVVGIVLTWSIVFIVGIGIAQKNAWSSWWAFIGLGAFTAVVSGVIVAHEKHKAHQLHREDIRDRAHHRAMIELAIRGDHSAEHITATSSFRAISKYMGPTTVNIKDNQLGQIGQGNTTAPPPLPAVIEELAHNALEFAYGLDPTTGQLVKTTLPKAVHIQLLGNTGMGKSRQSTSILTQLCTRNDPEHLALALIDCEGETTAPFLSMPHVRYQADEPREAARALRGLVAELERRDVSRQVWPVLVVFVEEFLNLRRTMPADYRDQALEDYTTLALRGRKRGMFLFSIGQTAYVEKAIRDAQLQFMSSMAFAIQPRAAKSSGFTNTELLNQLYAERKPGQFLLERPAGDAILLAPYVESTAVPGLLADCTVVSNGLQTDEVRNHFETTLKPNAQSTEPALEARARQVRELIKKGVQRGDIIAEIWGVSSGAPYTKASQELDRIIATLL